VQARLTITAPVTARQLLIAPFTSVSPIIYNVLIPT
jgi:hypothetical protein